VTLSLRGIPNRLLAGLQAVGGLGLQALRKHLVARGAKWATKLVGGLCPPVLHLPRHSPPDLPPMHSPEPEEPFHTTELSHFDKLPGGVPWKAGAQCCAGCRPSPSVPGWIEIARVVLLLVCPSHNPLQTLLCTAFCTLEAVVSGLLAVARRAMHGSVCFSRRRMLLAIAGQGHVQQRPRSESPQLRAGVVQWLTSPGISAMEVLS
jgi:hypothetical protein